MNRHPTRRSTFLAALAGVLAGALLVGVIPVMAANGDNMILGASNQAGRSTWLASRGPSVMKIRNTAGAIVLDLRNGGTSPPLAVDSDQLVTWLNADYLDGWHGSSYLRDDQPELIQAGTAGDLFRVLNSGSGDGIYGEAGSGGDGVVGQAFHATKSGVYGFHNGSGFGMTGRSSSGFGLFAWGGGDSSGTDGIGDLLLQGTRGEIYAEGNYLNLYTKHNVNIDLDDDNNSSSYFRIWNGAEGEVFSVDESGNMTATGAKSAVVETESYGSRLMYAVESPGVWFEDFGNASLADGAAAVEIEPLFAETVNLAGDYHVFLTPLGECGGLYVAAKTSSGFEVRELGGGTSSVDFDYRIVARRLGYEDVRLEVVQPEPR